LLDTDTVSATLLPRPKLVVVRHLAAVPPDEQFTSAITVGELTYGAVRRVRTGLQERIQAFLDSVPLLPFDSAAACRYGELRAQLERDAPGRARPAHRGHCA
jgi:tRNA(fMet)-specific endonuclease VapC